MSRPFPWSVQAELLRAINRSGLSYEEILGAIQKAVEGKKEREKESEAVDEHQLNMLDAMGTDI